MFDGPVARLFPVIHVLSLPETASFAANVLRVLSFSPLIQSLLALFDINWFREPVSSAFIHSLSFDTHALYGQRPNVLDTLSSSYPLSTPHIYQHTHFIRMAEVMAQQGASLGAPSSRQDVVSELLDDYTYEDSYDVEDMSPKASLAPAFKELPPPPPRTDSLRDPKAEAIQRMNTKFQLRGKQFSLHVVY